ncbi:calcium-activated chloride channel regulator 1-like isoform X1 [Dermacentor albipictus]|uniref:calcium-activated chloride channel regulator 1-like isoform X1 n=2 Tax=Dermacentor albipictus TaxID=60249 RepID=UPI0038FC3068
MFERLLLALASFCLLGNGNGLEIDDADGGYINLLVSIHQDTLPNEVVVDNLKALLQSSSELLHEATGGRVFIKQVVMEFPKTWPQRTTARSSPKWLFSKSDVRVEALESGHKDDSFSTKLRRRCGQRGDFIRVPPRVLSELNTTKEALKDATYAFVNEWAYFRYGVFYEYGRLGHKKYPLSYCPCCNKKEVRWNSCSDRIHHTVLNPNICKYHEGCYATEECVVAITQPEQDPVESSIMFLPRLDNVKNFCNSEQESHRHNNLAPNMHNEICNGESTWDVIRRNKDLMSLPPPNMSKPIVVQFDEIQQKPGTSLRAVLVLDVSGSMKAHRRLETLKEALDGFLLRLLDDFVQLAIVAFGTTAKVQHRMMTVNHQTLKGFREAVKKLSPDGKTCIGCGLQRALEVLNTSRESPEGAIIVLLTDGVENEQPYIDDVWPQLLALKVEVVAMAMGDKAEQKLENLAAQTKGQSYFFPDHLQKLPRIYIEASNPVHEFTYHRLGLITTSETANVNATEPMVQRQVATRAVHHEFTLQVAPFKADAELSPRKATNELTTLAESTGLIISQSADGECFPNDGYNPRLDIYMAFADPFNVGKRYLKPVPIMYKTKRFTGTVRETFILDEALGNNTIVSIIRESAGSYSLMAWLVDPLGKRCHNCEEVESDGEKSLTIPSPAMPGTWTLQVECSMKDQVFITMMVKSQIRDLKNKPIVVLAGVWNDKVIKPEDAKIFVDLAKGGHVVLDADVTAVVRNTQGISCPARLRDDGKDPDIMPNDGSYSGYFTQFTGRGRYAVRAYVYGNNKTTHAYRTPGFPPNIIAWDEVGSLPTEEPDKEVIEDSGNYTFEDTLLGERKPTQPFQRVAGGTYFQVTNDLRQADVPPGIMKDLKAVDGDIEIDRTPVVRLTWTWPGAHMTHGKAAEVEIRGSINEENLKRDFDSQERLSTVVKGNLDPLPGGSKHDVTIALPREWEMTRPGDRDYKLEAYLAARVINADGLKGELSRSITLLFTIPNFTAEYLTTGASIPTQAVPKTKPGPARTTTTLAKPYTKTAKATTSTPPPKAEPVRNTAATATPEVDHARKNDHSSVIIWILLALVAGVVMTAITTILLLRATLNPIAEDQGLTTTTATLTTM